MPELQLDVTVANRFISSLSKSLQALCHGCMDFDNGIEIVGYINVNIDSGSKVDYVLNEKVLKSTTNSMTFVSNSFLAKKESQKQTRDGACSPIPQSQAFTSNPSRMQGSHQGAQFHRPTSQYSPHSQVSGGSQKRSWADDWRHSSKRHRVHNSQTDTQSFNDQNSQQPHSQLHPSSTYSESSFKQPHVPSFTGTSDSTLRLQMSIKKEVLEADNQRNNDEDNLTSDQSEDQTHDSSHDEVSKIQIKSDPDATKSNSGEEPTPNDSNNITASESTDFKGTFLEPPSSSDPADDNNHSESDNQLPAFDQSSESVSAKDQFMTDEINVASTSASNLGNNDTSVSADNEPSDVPIEYDQAAEDGSYSQSAYEDAGEGSSDAGQFEVIEIDDEDEDVQAMFGDNQESIRHMRHCHPKLTSTDLGARIPMGSSYFRILKNHPVSNISSSAQSPYNINHTSLYQPLSGDMHSNEYLLPYRCSICNKGYRSHFGLYHHKQHVHENKTFPCPICESRFTQKGKVKRHLNTVHKVALCPTCSSIFKFGADYNQHVLHCCK